MVNLSPDTEAALSRYQQAEDRYRPNDAVAAHLADLSVIQVVAPSGMGKTTVMAAAAALDHRFGLGTIFTSRSARSDDPAGIRYVPHTNKGLSEIFAEIDHGDVVQYTIHRFSREIYGTTLDDYPAEFNLLAVMAAAVENFRKLPFKQNEAVGLIAEPDNWQTWFERRFPEGNQVRAKRLAEAEVSLEWLLAQPVGTVSWLRNRAGEPEKAAAELIRITLHESAGDETLRHTAQDMLAKIRSLLK